MPPLEPSQTPQPEQPQVAVNPSAEPVGAEESVEQPDNTPLLTWQNKSSDPQDHRSTTWYIGLGLIFSAALIAAIWTQTWLFLPLGILVPWALAAYAGRGEESHQYALYEGGIQIDSKFYAYDLFKAYFYVAEAHRVIFELVPTQRFGALITLQTTGDETGIVEEILSSVLPQTNPQGYVGESIFKRLKF